MESSESESKPFQSRSTFQIPGRTRREERLSLLQIEIGVPNWFRRRTFRVFFLIELKFNRVRLTKSSASEPGLST